MLTEKTEPRGAAYTTLLAIDCIDNDSPLLIVNSDQLVEWDSQEFIDCAMKSDQVDAVIATFESVHPKWSYCRLGGMFQNRYRVTEVAEKEVISNQATCGIYFWKHGSDYVKYAQQMIEKNIRTNGEFYVCPVFNEAIADGKIVVPYPVKKMHGLGTPEDLQEYLRCTS